MEIAVLPVCTSQAVSWQALRGVSSPGALLGMEGERSQEAPYLWDAADSSGRKN